MPVDLVILLACGLAGAAAGLALDVFGFLALVVAPSILLMVIAGASGSLDLAWWSYPVAWIVQQASYLTAMQLVRPGACRVLLERVRVMTDR